MKINRILLKISHFFGLRLDEEHQDDITINIPTSYPEKNLNINISDEVAMELFGLNVKPPVFIQYLRDKKLKEIGI